MRHKHSLSFFFVPILLWLPSYGHAQLWSGILASSRATDWNAYPPGVKGGIPSATWTQCGSTIAAYTGNASTINSAIANCGTNQYVQLGAGTFTLSTGISITRSNVVLRGMGANQTFMVTSASAGASQCEWQAAIMACVQNEDRNSYQANWTGGYSQGSTSVTLDSISGDNGTLTVGNFIQLFQQDDTVSASGGWPNAGDMYACGSMSPYCSSEGVNYEAPYVQNEFHEVTGISGTGPYTITLATPILAPNWRSSQSPGATWYSTVINHVGVENLSIDWTSLEGISNNGDGINFSFVMDSWIKGVRLIATLPEGSACSYVAGVQLSWTFRTTYQDSYMYGPVIGQSCLAGVALITTGNALIQNNIFHYNGQPIYSMGPTSGSVIGYNYVVGFYSTDGQAINTHYGGEFFNLLEGNVEPSFASDSVHGTHYMQTLFRNDLSGGSQTAGGLRMPFYISSYGRFNNIVGNVLGDTTFGYTAYQTNQAENLNAVYQLGWDESGYVNNDPNVLRTLMRWGNWDSNTQFVHWCGGSSDTNWSSCVSGGWGYGGAASEIPSTITNFSNPVPTLGDTNAGQGALPASFYLSSKPSWWVFPFGNGSTPWPGIGPDVSGGNIANTAGHAYLNPAANCYLNVMGGPANGGGGPLTFNAGTCYPPAPPTHLVAAAD
jgi:hypothetical protein